jgi:hypothetical protein
MSKINLNRFKKLIEGKAVLIKVKEIYDLDKAKKIY